MSEKLQQPETERPGIVSFPVAPHLMEQSLCIPEGHRIVGAEWDWVSRTVRLYVEGPDLPQVPIGQRPTDIMPIVKQERVTQEDGREKIHITWDWNLPSIPVNKVEIRLFSEVSNETNR